MRELVPGQRLVLIRTGAHFMLLRKNKIWYQVRRDGGDWPDVSIYNEQEVEEFFRLLEDTAVEDSKLP